jgi:hypothetical protein
METKEIERIDGIITNNMDYSKITITWLKEIVSKYNPEVVDSIFDPSDTCFCSSTNRKKYKKDFISWYNNNH